eukprot:CAMPEP_0174834390 /NCGR_PEP_ID=MMETSP1114-20130205/4798_1 /TAXON_ID=312471 /ORGANISM="Neobodo designis, Strain CCAP 1951/1" /LENGTH=479 /DNA_ID=CAMNT_0016068297 /DNA_START=32 /DNA_END=1471 /DNA_ORIENTATION=-
MSLSRSDYRYQRELSRAGRQRAMTNMQQRIPGPERYLSLRDQAIDEKSERRFVSFMGPAHSAMMEDREYRGPQAPARPRALTAKKKQRVVSEAEALLDEIYGRKPVAIEAPPEEEKEEAPREPTPPPPEEAEEPPVAEEEKPAEEETPAEEEPPADPEPVAEESEQQAEEAQPEPEAAHAAEQEEPPTRPPKAINGWLEKFAIGRSGATGSKNWKRRWFALTDTASAPLAYFESDEPGAEAKGAVLLDTANSRLVTKPNKHSHPEANEASDSTDLVVVFVEDGNERKLLLRCPDSADHTRWVDELSIRVAVVDAASDMEPPPQSSAVEQAPEDSAASAGTESEQSPRDVGPQAKGGWMEKFAVGKSGATGAKNWKRRWFVLPAATDSKAMLTYHEKEGGKSKALGKVPVNDGKARLITAPSKVTHKEADPEGGKDLVIVFFEDGKEYKLLLRCDSAEDHAAWVQELRRRVSVVDHEKDV